MAFDGGFHFHVLLLFDSKVDIKNSRPLDIQYQGHDYHGNYQPARSIERIVQYVCKQGHYITSLNNVIDGKFLSPKEMLIRDVDQEKSEHLKCKITLSRS